MILVLLSLLIWHLSSAPYKSLHMRRRARALAVVLIHTDLWDRSKASLITLADFQGSFFYNVLGRPVPHFAVVIT